MKFLAFLVLFSAIAIASCAAYFSIIGLKLLFVGSGISIVIMGIALEVGKFITVTFLKQKWEEISLLLKTYLIAATIVLMGITSVGIYGYLSAGYNATAVKVQGYEQLIESNNRKVTALKIENERLLSDTGNQTEIDLINANRNKFVEQQLKLIEQREQRVREIRGTTSTNNKATEDITAAKAALDSSKAVLDSEINRELEQIKLINDRLAILDEEVQTWLKQGNRGLFRQNGADKAREVKLAQEKERAEIDRQIKERQNKIQNLRDEYKLQVDRYNERVASIESRVQNQNNTQDQQIKEIEKEIVAIRQSIEQYNTEVENTILQQVNKKQSTVVANKQQVQLNEGTIQELQNANTNLKEQIIRTDIGTFKFVANSLGLPLDKTVAYFIGAIMLVFDPLAVCLVLCFNHLVRGNASRKRTPQLLNENVPVSIAEVVDTPTPTPTNIPTPTPTPMKSSEILFGKPKVKETQPVKEGEVERLEKILEQQRKEKAERASRLRPA